MENSIERHIKKWCENSGWTDSFVQKGQFYAFPPGAVIPLPVPTAAIESAKKVREIQVRHFKQLLLVLMPSLAVIVLTYICSFPLWLSLIQVILLSVIGIFIRKLWPWLSFLILWTNSH